MSLNILLSNDDGVFAEGIEVLAEALLPLGKLTVVAPNAERSASSHSLTLEHPLRAKKVAFPVAIEEAYSVTGTPSDCVKLAISSLMTSPPNLVITGINRGANLSVDVFYSGTVAAAFEGIFNRIPSIAFSLATWDPNSDFRQGIPWIRTFVKWAIANPPAPGIMYNVNIPPCDSSLIKGYRITRLGNVQYRDSYELRHDPGGRPYYWLDGEPEIMDHCSDADNITVKEGFVSVTPIRAELTDFAQFEKLRKTFKLENPEDDES